jgi:hypothetical protein
MINLRNANFKKLIERDTEIVSKFPVFFLPVGFLCKIEMPYFLLVCLFKTFIWIFLLAEVYFQKRILGTFKFLIHNANN